MTNDPLGDHLYTLRDSPDQYERGAALDMILNKLAPLIRKRHQSADGVEDARQEAAIAILDAAAEYDPDRGTTATAYLYAIVSYKLAELWVTKNRPCRKPQRQILSLNCPHRAVAHSSTEAIDYLPDTHQYNTVGETEDLDQLRRAWKDYAYRLTPVERRALIGTLKGFSYPEIAERLSVDCKAVDNALQRANRKAAFTRITIR